MQSEELILLAGNISLSLHTSLPGRTLCLLRVTHNSDVTEHLQLLLRKAGHHFHTTAEKEVVRIMKEKTCYLALNPSKEESLEASTKYDNFILPDGNAIKVDFSPATENHNLNANPLIRSLFQPAWTRTLPSTRDIVQPRDRRFGIRGNTSSCCRFDQQSGFGLTKIALFKCGIIWRVHVV